MDSRLSFLATEQFRKKLIASNLTPYYVKGSSTPMVNPEQMGVKETNWIDVPIIDQPDLIDGNKNEKSKLYVVNKYGPDGGFKNSVTVPLIINNSNQGEFPYLNGQTNKLVESAQEQKDLIILNQFGPQDGWSDASSELDTVIRQLNDRAEYYTFRASSYSPSSILLNDNPSGSLGSLSQDSSLAKIAATRLRSLFEESIAIETYQETVGRRNSLDAINDPFRALGIISGKIPLIEPDWNLTVPNTLIGKVGDFISRVSGVYSPYSYIPGDYFNLVQPKSLTNQILNSIGGFFGFPNILPSKKSSSDLFLQYTGAGTKKTLFNLLYYNQFSPDYRANFLSNLNFNAPSGNYYIGKRTQEPLDIVSPSGEIPVNEFGVEVETNVYGPSLLGQLYEGDKAFKFGLNITPTTEGGGIQGGFTWVSPKYKDNAGFKVGVGGQQKGQDDVFQSIAASYDRGQSTSYEFKSGSILDDTQRIINSQPKNGKRLQHVGNALDQVSKVFNDGYREITKGSRVIRYTNQNGIFKGEEYGRVFAKDIPYYTNQKLVKSDGNIRQNPYSVLDKTYNLNIYPTSGPDSTTIVGGQVKKFMLSIENLAWRTSRRPGLRYTDLAESEKGPNGGRIMWFPPYDVTFNENNSVTWDGTAFLGRPEKIYTYQSSERTGQLSFKIVVDHPSVMNLLVNKVLATQSSKVVADQIIDSFFAGLTKFDIYELAKRYNNFSQTELKQIQDTINNSSNKEKIKDIVNQNLPKGGNGSGGPSTSNSSVGIQNYTPQLTPYKSKEFYFDYKDDGGTNYLESVNDYLNNTLIVPEQKAQIENSKTSLSAFTNSINELLDSNPNVVVEIRLKSGNSFNEGKPGTIQDGRNNCIEDTIKTYVKQKNRVSFKKSTTDDSVAIQPLNYTCNTSTTNNYDVGPVACRRVIIEDIVETPLPNTRNPNGGVELNGDDAVDSILRNTLNQLGNNLNKTGTNTESAISKKIIRKLLSEADYFQFVKETNPVIFDSLTEKLKFFHPGFHSMTPEGLNERLTFLLQCTRPGDTIPTKQSDNTLIDKDARNTSFGAPPVCILRVGDFYNSKIIVDSCNFTYDDGKFDLNPEGIGVQPMIVSVSMGFKFIGGQSLKGPVEELQNALSFNFFANTEMYDERATSLLDISGYNKEFIDETSADGDTTKNTNTNYKNEGGTLIGQIVGGKLDNDGTRGSVDYKPLFGEFIKGFENYYGAVLDKLGQVNSNYNYAVLKLYTKDRLYSDGEINEFGIDVSKSVKIFGKSDYQEKINTMFTNLFEQINDEDLTIQIQMNKQNFKKVEKQQFNKNLKDVVTKAKDSFNNKLNTITNELSNSEINLTRNIDRANYIIESNDGLITTEGNPKVYTLLSATTISDLETNYETIGDKIKQLDTDLENKKIITDDYNNRGGFTLFDDEFKVNADMLFYMSMGNRFTDDYDALLKDVTGTFTTTDWTNFISKEMNNYKIMADSVKTKSTKLFDSFKSEKSFKSTYLPPNYNELVNKTRITSIEIDTSPSTDEKTRLKNLYLGQNSNDNKNTFNGKIKF